MNKTRIEWADYTWNPIKGPCPVGCWYCYARKIYKRFGIDRYKKDIGEIQYCWGRGEYYGNLFFDKQELPAPSFIRESKRIFVCSTFELFHPATLDKTDIIECPSWREAIFKEIEFCKWHTFIILTKMPERIDRPMPPNVWLGVSLTGENGKEYDRFPRLAKVEALTKFVSFEPLLHAFDVWELFDEYIPDWMIVGRLTGHGTARDITRKGIQDIVDFAAEEDIPIFLKNNLRDIWGSNLIQEFPKIKAIAEIEGRKT